MVSSGDGGGRLGIDGGGRSGDGGGEGGRGVVGGNPAKEGEANEAVVTRLPVEQLALASTIVRVTA